MHAISNIYGIISNTYNQLNTEKGMAACKLHTSSWVIFIIGIGITAQKEASKGVCISGPSRLS